MIIRRGPGVLRGAAVAAGAVLLGATAVAGVALGVAVAVVVAVAGPARAASPIRTDVWMTLDHSVVTWDDLTFELTVRWGNKGLEDAADVNASLGGGPTPRYDLIPGTTPAGWTTSTAGTFWRGPLRAGEVHETTIRVHRLRENVAQVVEQFGGRIDGGVERPEDSLDDRFVVDVHSCDLVSVYQVPAAVRSACASHAVTYLPPPVQHNVPSEPLRLPAAGRPVPPSTRPIPSPGAATGRASTVAPTRKVAAAQGSATARPGASIRGAAGQPGGAAATPTAPTSTATEGTAALTAATTATTTGTTTGTTTNTTPGIRAGSVVTQGGGVTGQLSSAAASPSSGPGEERTGTSALGPLAPVAAWTTSSPWAPAVLLLVLLAGPLGVLGVRRRRG